MPCKLHCTPLTSQRTQLVTWPCVARISHIAMGRGALVPKYSIQTIRTDSKEQDLRLKAAAEINDSLSEARLDHQRSTPRTTPSPKQNPRPKPEDAKEGQHLSRSCSSEGRGDPQDRMAQGQREQESGPSRAGQPGCQKEQGRRGRGRQRENKRRERKQHLRDTPKHTTHTARSMDAKQN